MTPRRSSDASHACDDSSLHRLLSVLTDGAGVPAAHKGAWAGEESAGPSEGGIEMARLLADMDHAQLYEDIQDGGSAALHSFEISAESRSSLAAFDDRFPAVIFQ
ncbi:PREDICTED: uncharacterized protein LOC106818746 isoform X2 [Priapulus caudatus]|uniref:Uncharacterized protein LOC106818746 isoform X2 n=1 Tax=Priapulus caudatus TaxID=37621 RepID=A0ABM1F382_PRICU|nr:PREDICTED: uncharacterized protein LOC106818746 isoform X2 [Priapulus caudatus]